jgi:hypothetical protein
MAAVVTADRDAAAQLCRADVPLKLASPAGLRSIEQAVQPVYRTLDAHPATRGTLAAIRALRASGVSHQGPTCAPSHVPAGKHTPLDGTYRRSATQRQVARHFHIAPASVIPENYGDFALVMDRGRFASTQHNTKACTWQAGRVSITGARIEFDVTSSGGVAPTDGNNKPGERFVAKPQLYHDTLTLHPITPTDLATIVWLRTTQHPLASALDARCHPPATALPH